MASTDRKLKWQRIGGPFIRACSADRLTRLPDEVLAQILSRLPTKEAAASKVLSKRMPRAFSCITMVDLDDSNVSLCSKHPHLVERSSLFESFVDNVLHELSPSQHSLTRYRLRFGGDKTTSVRSHVGHGCKPTCFPNPEPARLYKWISYPLAHCCLRELNLSIHVRNTSEFQYPPELFTRQSLEVLTLDSNLEINSSTEIPPICLPNLKILNLHSFVFSDHVFVATLVSNCPALEDLSVSYCFWDKADRVTISSQSLQRFTFFVLHDLEPFRDIVLIETPSLQYFYYSDSFAMKYILNMNALVEATVDVPDTEFLTKETSFRNLLSVTGALSNVKYLTLYGWFTKGWYGAALTREPLPEFRNLKFLKLGEFCRANCSGRWDVVLLIIFLRSPLLEELSFMEGFVGDIEGPCEFHMLNSSDAATMEAITWGLTQTAPAPPCCKSHLRRITIYECLGSEVELNLIRFLLRLTFVLEELVISMSKRKGIRLAPNVDQFKKRVQEIPRASKSCCIIYSDDKPDYNIMAPAPSWGFQIAG